MLKPHPCGHARARQPPVTPLLRRGSCSSVRSYAWKLHVAPVRVYTYTAPASPQPLSVAAVVLTLVEQLASSGAPTTIVSPEIATAHPNWSFAPAFDALR